MRSQVNRCLNHVNKECVRLFRDVVGVGQRTGDFFGSLSIVLPGWLSSAPLEPTDHGFGRNAIYC